jgi:hypothetical protein
MTVLRVHPTASCRLTGRPSRVCLNHVLKRDSSSSSSITTSDKPHDWYSLRSRENIAEDEIAKLAALRRPPLTLGDLLKYVAFGCNHWMESQLTYSLRHGRPPLSRGALLDSANFTLSLLPARLAYRIQCLRNLPFIVVSNPHVSKIYNNYLHSLSTLLPYQQRRITNLEEEKRFADVLADLVQTHNNTIAILARGFLECRKYVSPADVTRFLDSHLRARIGTRLIAEQHLALHFASQPISDVDPYPPTKAAPPLEKATVSSDQDESNYIGVIDTALQPARIIKSCENFVGEICELKYGVRPRVIIGGEPNASFAYVPVHVEYIITELLKNAFRAVVESGNEHEPIEVTIAAAPDVPGNHVQEVLERPLSDVQGLLHGSPDAGTAFSPSVNSAINNQMLLDRQQRLNRDEIPVANENIRLTSGSSQSITIRIRDRGGGIPPEVLPHIWSYSFTTFSEDDLPVGDNGNIDALNTISGSGSNSSTIAGLGYGLPLSRAYAQYFGGSIAVQSLWGWGTDVYLTLQGVGKIE